MAQFVENRNRKLLPRWRDFATTCIVGELRASRTDNTLPPVSGSDFEEKLTEWHREPSLSFACQLVGAGHVHGRLAEVGDAADFVLKHREVVSPLATQIAESARGMVPLVDQMPAHRDRVAKLRQLLRGHPRDPITWVDLAREYTIVGKIRQADRCLRAAIQMAPFNRFVLRSATRFYVHNREPDRAEHLLRTAPGTVSDPWLLGPLISVASLIGTTTGLARPARRHLAESNFSDWELNELAATLATIEFEHGNARGARKLFRRSLVAPTENTVAQVRWAADERVGLDLDPALLNIPRTFEAAAWTYHNVGEWSESLVQSKSWLEDQAFSERPAALGSFVAAVALDDHLQSIEILRKSLRANPESFTLLNNLAYSLASLNQLDEAESTLASITESQSNVLPTILKLATSGLVRFRRGDMRRGLAFYLEAMDRASRASRRDLQDQVLTFLALELVRHAETASHDIVSTALSVTEQSSDPILKLLSQRLKSPNQE